MLKLNTANGDTVAVMLPNCPIYTTLDRNGRSSNVLIAITLYPHHNRNHYEVYYYFNEKKDRHIDIKKQSNTIV